MLLGLLVLLLSILAGYWGYIVHVRARHLKSLAGPPPLPYVGNGLSLLDSTRLFLTLNDFARRYGSFYKLWIGAEPIVVVGRPDVLKEVLSSNWDSYIRDSILYEIYNDIGGGLVLMHGDAWSHDRKLLTEAFKLENLVKFSQRLPQHVDNLLGIYEQHRISGEQLNVQELFQHLTFDIICDATIGKNFNTLLSNSHKYEEAYEVILRYKLKCYLDITRSYRYYTSRENRACRDAVRMLQDLMRQVLESRRETITEDDSDILATMVLANRRDPNAFPETQLIRHLTTFMLAGHDTTTNQLTWCLYFLAANPDIEKKVHEEIDQVLQSRRPQFADVSKLSYLSLVAKETARMRPSAPAFGRELTCDAALGGLKLKKGQRLIISPYIAQHDPESFPDPYRFDPMRYADKSRQPSLFSHIAYSSGPRTCIGKRMAETEIMLIIAMIVQKYRLRLVPGRTVEMEHQTTMRARGGMWMTVDAR